MTKTDKALLLLDQYHGEIHISELIMISQRENLHIAQNFGINSVFFVRNGDYLKPSLRGKKRIDDLTLTRRFHECLNG